MSSRAANQTKTEPFPAGPGESEAPTPGADDPQAPRTDRAQGTSEELPPVQGIHVPEVDEPDPRT